MLVDKAPVLTDKATVLDAVAEKPIPEKVLAAEAVKKPTEKTKDEVSNFG